MQLTVKRSSLILPLTSRSRHSSNLIEINHNQRPAEYGTFSQLSWPMAFAWIRNVRNASVDGAEGLPWRWRQYRAAFHSLVKQFKSATGGVTTAQVKMLCHARYRDDPTLPFDLHSIFDVQMPHQLETVGFFSSSFQKRIAKERSTLFIPSWGDPKHKEHYPELWVEKRWKRLWPRIKSLPFLFSPQVQAWYYVVYRLHSEGMKGWSDQGWRPMPQHTPDCTLCGREVETRDHLYRECSVALEIWHRGIDPDSSPPEFTALIAPNLPRRHPRFTAEDFKAVLYT